MTIETEKATYTNKCLNCGKKLAGNLKTWDEQAKCWVEHTLKYCSFECQAKHKRRLRWAKAKSKMERISNSIMDYTDDFVKRNLK